MVRKLSVMLLLVGVLLTVSGQNSEKDPLSRFYGGIRVGFTATQVSGDDLAGFHKVGAHAGQLELDFTMKGSHSHTPKNQVADNFYSLTLGYVEVPLILDWTAGKWQLWGKSFQFDIELGPAFGVNVFSREREANGLIVGRPPFRRFEFSGLAGLSLMVADHHSVNFRFENSIIPVRLPTWVYDRVINKQLNTALIISYCYQF